jgi:hypothetical protein
MKNLKVNLPVLVESTAYALARAQIRASCRAELARNPYVLDDFSLEESLNTGSLSSFLYEAEDEKKSLFDNEDSKNIGLALESIDSTIEEVRSAVENAAAGKMTKTLGVIDDMRGELKAVGKLDWMKLAYGGQDALQDKLLKVNNTTADILAAIGMVADALVESGELMANAGIPEQFHEQTIQALADLHEEHGGIPLEQTAGSSGPVDEQEGGTEEPPPSNPESGIPAENSPQAPGAKVKFSTPDEIRKFVSKKFEVPGWFSQAWSGGLEAASDEAGDFMKKTGSLLKGVFGKKEKPKIPPEGFADDYMELTLAEALALAEVAAPWKELVTASSDTAGEAGAEALAGAQTVPTGGLPQGGDGGGGGQGGDGAGPGRSGGALPPGTERPTTRTGGGASGKDIATFEDLMTRATAPAVGKQDLDFAKIMGALINKDPKSQIEFVDELPKEEEAPKEEEEAPEGAPAPDDARPRTTEAWVHNRSLSQWLFDTPEPQPSRSQLAEAIFYKDFEDELRDQGVTDEDMEDVATELADRLDNEYNIKIKGMPKKGAGTGDKAEAVSGIPPEMWELMRQDRETLNQLIANQKDASDKDKETLQKMIDAGTDQERARLAADLEMDTRELEADIIKSASVSVENNSEEYTEEQRAVIDKAAEKINVKIEVEISATAIERYEAVVAAAEEEGQDPKIDRPPDGKISSKKRENYMSKLRRREENLGIKTKKKKSQKSSSKSSKKEETESKRTGKASSESETRTGAAATGQEVKIGGERGEPEALKQGYTRQGTTLAETLFDDNVLLSHKEVDDLHLIRWSRISGLPEDQVIETAGTSRLLVERREERREEWTDDDLVKLAWLRMAGLHTGEDYE